MGARALSGISSKQVKSACSSMHFNEEFEVNWMPVFFIKEFEDIQEIIRINRNGKDFR